MGTLDWKRKNSEQVLNRVKENLRDFLEEIVNSLGESVDYFADSEGRLDEDSFSRCLTEIAETIGIECLRMNTLSNSSREENVSNWKNKLESACQTNSNSFWNLSELSFYKNSLLKDFNQFKQSIENSVKSLKTINEEEFFKAEKIKQKRLLRSLNAQIEENHKSIMKSFQKFEEKLDSKNNSETSFQLKAMGLQNEERTSHMTGFHFIEMIQNQATGKLLFKLNGSQK